MIFYCSLMSFLAYSFSFYVSIIEPSSFRASSKRLWIFWGFSLISAKWDSIYFTFSLSYWYYWTLIPSLSFMFRSSSFSSSFSILNAFISYFRLKISSYNSEIISSLCSMLSVFILFNSFLSFSSISFFKRLFSSSRFCTFYCKFLFSSSYSASKSASTFSLL